MVWIWGDPSGPGTVRSPVSLSSGAQQGNLEWHIVMTWFKLFVHCLEVKPTSCRKVYPVYPSTSILIACLTWPAPWRIHSDQTLGIPKLSCQGAYLRIDVWSSCEKSAKTATSSMKTVNIRPAVPRPSLFGAHLIFSMGRPHWLNVFIFIGARKWTF